jgi:hypothetical protein
MEEAEIKPGKSYILALDNGDWLTFTYICAGRFKVKGKDIMANSYHELVMPNTVKSGPVPYIPI